MRVTIFFSGCSHDCPGCHNPLSHNFENGRPFTEELQTEIIDYIKMTPYISGVTLSGGDPMYSAAAIVPFAKRLKDECPDTNIWIYSGFTFEEIVQCDDMQELLYYCDVLVDGPFVFALKNPNLKYKGSTNQRTIDVKASILNNEISVL